MNLPRKRRAFVQIQNLSGFWFHNTRKNKMQGFINHNITHTSPSSINMWTEAPDAWIAKYVLGAKFGFSPAARAGVLAEDAVVDVLARGVTQADATTKAIETFARATLFDKSDKTAARGEMIPGMIDLALKELAQYGTPEFDEGGKQKKININCRVDDWTIPITGFLDFWYPQHGLVIDLKTSSKLPSEMSQSHLRQQAIYKAAMGNCAVKFLYCSGKKSAMYEPEDTSDTLMQIKNILRRQDKFLKIGNADLLREIVPVVNSYYWSEDSNLRKELYNL